MGGGGVEVASTRVLDAGVVGECGGFGAAGDLDALGGRHCVDVVEVEVLIAFELAELFGFGEAGEGVFAGDAGQRNGSFDEASEAFGGEIAGGGVGYLLAEKDAEADGSGAGFFELFNLTEADLGRELIAFVEDGFGVRGSGFEGAGEDIGGYSFEIGCDLGRHPFQDIAL